jgi:hypothetical protein
VLRDKGETKAMKNLGVVWLALEELAIERLCLTQTPCGVVLAGDVQQFVVTWHVHSIA